MSLILLGPDLLPQADSLANAGDLRDRGLALVALQAPDQEPSRVAGAHWPLRWPEDAADPGRLREALERLTREAGRSPGDGFLLSGHLGLAQAAESLGLRAILVQGDQGLDALLGATEADSKSIPVAADIHAAVRYLEAEWAEGERLGAFPFGRSAPVVPAAGRPSLSRSELVRIFGLAVLAGLTFALGLAYLLQEAYQTVSVPTALQWPIRILTLQWIPQTVRGLMFLLIGVAVGMGVTRFYARLGRSRRG